MKRWLSYAKPYVPYFIFGPICMIIEVIGEVMMPRMLGNMVDYLTSVTTEKEVDVASWVRTLVGWFGDGAPVVLTIMAGTVLTALIMMLGGIGGGDGRGGPGAGDRDPVYPSAPERHRLRGPGEPAVRGGECRRHQEPHPDVS